MKFKIVYTMEIKLKNIPIDNGIRKNKMILFSNRFNNNNKAQDLNTRRF